MPSGVQGGDGFFDTAELLADNVGVS